MSNRPDPVVFARYSYILAFVSAGIIFVTLLLYVPVLPEDLRRVLVNIVWLALITGGVGTFMAYAARSDFRRNPGPLSAINQARIGFRVNLGALSVTLVWAVMVIIIRILAAPR